MTDRELLELACKAYANEEIVKTMRGFERVVGYSEVMGCQVMTEWNPLTNDGDALRLAVALKLRIFTCQGCFGNITAVGMSEEYDLDSVSERHNDDPYSATRRAITRAAAEIGRVDA